MFNLLRALIKRKRAIDPAEIVEELWSPSFRDSRESRFVPEDTPSVRSGIVEHSLLLELKKKNVFGWAENPWYRYRDFGLEATIEPAPENGYSSSGFILRRADERNYYYFLISLAGHFRFDVVFNGSPRVLIGWTQCVVPEGPLRLRVVARGEYFGFYLDDEWIGEIEDDTIDAGGITFAAQNYDDRDSATYRLTEITVESRPVEVEAQYYRWRRYVPVDVERRLALARSFATNADFTAAIVQFNKAGTFQNVEVNDMLLLCECQVRSGLRAEAMETAEAILKAEPDNAEALAEKANLLYLDNRMVDLRDFIDSHAGLLEGNAVMWNLLGNAWYSLGNREKAAEAYEKASETDPEQPMYRINTARAYETVGEEEQAFRCYLDAAKILFREEDYLELAGIFPLVERLAPDNPETLALKGKIAFGEELYEDALENLGEALEAGTEDSSVFYLYGILLAQRGERERGDTYLEKATELEPGYYLYWFRLGENRHLAGIESESAVLRALALAPDDVWILNLAGLIHLEHDRSESALELLGRAFRQLEHLGEVEGRDDIIANYSEALYRTGDRESAYNLLRKKTDSVVLLNQLGNLLAEDDDFEGAAAIYERASRLDPDDRDVLLNYAAACIEADRILQAEELLARLLDGRHDSSAYNLMGNAALIKGEHLRAEAAFTEALKIDPGNREAALNLADLRIRRGNFDEAKETLRSYLSDIDDPRIQSLREKVRLAVEVDITCFGCGRMWTSERHPEEQPVLKLRGELPDESPAGRCPACEKVFCIECAKSNLIEGRFHCPDCGEALKLSGDHLKLHRFEVRAVNESLPTVIIPYTGSTDDDQPSDIFVYLRPETNGVLAESSLLRVVEGSQKYSEEVDLVYLANIPGEFIVSHRIIENRYRYKMPFAENGGAVFTDRMKSRFENYFEEDFDTNRVLGAFQALAALDISEEELFGIRVPLHHVLVMNCQTVKKIGDAYVVNYDIPALIHKNNNKTDIAVMLFRSTQSKESFHLMIGEMTRSLIEHGILKVVSHVVRAFHYTKGPFEQILDARGHLYKPDGNPVSLEDMQFCSFLRTKGILYSEVDKALDFPIMEFRDKDGEIVEECLYGYSEDATYQEAFEILSSSVSQYLNGM